jgi:hypothetical protein
MSVTDFGDPHQVIHIPARDLTGTREAKLAEIDTLLAQLQVVRLALCGQTLRLEGLNGAAGQRPRLRHRLWSWLATRLRAVLRNPAPGSPRTLRAIGREGATAAAGSLHRAGTVAPPHAR